jgi:DNA-directed RNA polymerase sigma subunit (sigma70/sigma32)
VPTNGAADRLGEAVEALEAHTRKTRGRGSRSKPAARVVARDAETDRPKTVPEADEPAAEPVLRRGRATGAALVPADSLQRYLAEIRRIPVLSREEEHGLAVRWHEGRTARRRGSSSLPISASS